MITKPAPLLWKGFEIHPEGALLEQVIDLSQSMGVAYERSCDFFKDFHIHDRLMFVFPRGSSIMEVRTQKSQKTTQTWVIDHSTVLIVPKNVVHDDEGKSAIYDTLALYPDEPLLKNVFKSLKTHPSQVEKFTSSVAKIHRTSWLSHLLEEYFFRRIVTSSRAPSQLEFFEKEITQEVLRCALDIKEGLKATTSWIDTQKTPDRALQFIENHLFENLSLQTIGKEAGMSVSTLLREFKKKYKKTPYEYIRHRRLDEAKNLLKKETHSVGEVATLVGYENFGAFSEAFKKKFGMSPSKQS